MYTVVEHRHQLRSWERVAALLAAGIALALNVAAAAELFTPQATFGYQLIYTNGFEVTRVDAGTAAQRAGITPGDHLDFHNSSLHDRIVALAYRSAHPGEAVSFVLVHDGRPRALTLRAGLLTPSESREALFSPLASFLRLAGFGYIVVALVILLRRPSRMTWGLFLYLVSATDITLYGFSERMLPVAALASDILSVAGTLGLVIFAARFPDDRAVGWRVWLDRLAIPAAVLFVIPNVAWDAQTLYAGESPSSWMSYGSTLGALAIIVVAGVTLVITYFETAPRRRQRLQWVIVGVFFTLLNYASDWGRYWSLAYPLATSDAVIWIATLLYACAPFAVAYAVIRQRVFEISFVVSRTLVYSIVTITLFGTFALVEWIGGRLIEHAGVAGILLAGTAVVLAYSLHAIYGRIEGFVEGTLFRRRHEAERRVAAVAAGLPYAESGEAVQSALIDEPVQAYALGSARLFVRNETGEYVDGGKALDRAIPLQLQGLRGSLRLHDADAALAVPVFVRSRLEAVVVYGPHVDGEDVDPDEVASLQALGAAAGVAYNHLETARAERDLARWRKLAERQARELAVVRERLELLDGRPIDNTGENVSSRRLHGYRGRTTVE